MIASTSRRALVAVSRPISCQCIHKTPTIATWPGPSRGFASTSAHFESGQINGSHRRTKIDTVPFLLHPTDASKIVETAAHTAFGLTYVFQLGLSRFLKRLFNFHYEPPLKRVAFRALLLPTWRVDLRVSARGVLSEMGMTFQLTATDASLPGFSLSPLDQLSVTAGWETEPVQYDASAHSQQHDQNVTIIPFTHSPVHLIEALKERPRINAQKHGISYDVTSVQPTLFAAYPLYLPVYLGEFENTMNDQKDRVTCVAFGATTRTAFAVYPTFLGESARWLPDMGGVEVSLGGIPNDVSKVPPTGALSKIGPELSQVVSSGTDLSLRLPITPKELEASPVVMSWSDHAQSNRAYIEAHEELVMVEAMTKRLEAIPEGVRAVTVSLRDGVKMGDGSNLRADMKKRLVEAQEKLESAKPDWLKMRENDSARRPPQP
ncbi:hypothetical protein T439DRAFT_322865 [Meredithblackwellia eburnea MCA 4105]